MQATAQGRKGKILRHEKYVADEIRKTVVVWSILSAKNVYILGKKGKLPKATHDAFKPWKPVLTAVWMSAAHVGNRYLDSSINAPVPCLTIFFFCVGLDDD